MLAARASAEVAAIAAIADGPAEAIERQTFRDAVTSLFDLEERTAGYLEAYFDRCAEGKSEEIWRTFPCNCGEEVLRLLLSVAVSVADADGYTGDAEIQALSELAAAMGIDLATVMHERPHTEGQGPGGPWWVVLGVDKNASEEEVTFAFRKVAMQYHPDLWSRTSPDEQRAAETRMKAANAAFEEAKRVVRARQEYRGAKRPASASAGAASARGSPTSEPPKPATPIADEPIVVPETVARPSARASTPDAGAPNDQNQRAWALATVAFVLVIMLAVMLNVSKQQHAERSNRNVVHSEEADGFGRSEEAASNANRASAPELEAADPRVAKGKEIFAEYLAAADESHLSEVVVAFDAAIQREPGEASLYYWRGSAHLAANRLDDAIADFDKAIRIDPTITDAHVSREIALARIENRAPAEVDYGKLRELTSEKTARFSEGAAEFGAKSFELQNATSTNRPPQLQEAYRRRGLVRLEDLTSQHTIAELTEMIHLSPAGDAYFQRGLAYYKELDYDRAISDFSLAIRHDRTMIQAYVHRAILYETKGERAKSQVDIATAKELGWLPK